jgi:hypothetical protein
MNHNIPVSAAIFDSRRKRTIIVDSFISPFAMKKLYFLFSLAFLLGCGSADSSGSGNEADNDAPASEPKTEIEAPVKQKSPYIGSWKVSEVDGQAVQVEQVFSFNEDGSMSQSLMGKEVSKGNWKTVDQGILGIGETGKEDLFEVESVDATTLIFSWKEKRSVLQKQ